MTDSINVVIESSAWLQHLAPSEEGPRKWDVEVRHDSGVTLRAHDVVLSENSAFFREGFDGKKHVDLKEEDDGVSLCALRTVLESMYGIPSEVDAQNVYDVLVTATHLQVHKIRNDCFKFLKTHLSVENALSTWRKAHGRYFPASLALQKAGARVIFENFMEICTSEAFLDLKPEELKALLSHRPASRKKESVVVDAVITWLNNKTWTLNFQEAFGVLETIQWNKVRRAQLAKMKSVQDFEGMQCGSREGKLFQLEVLKLLLAPHRKIVAISNHYNKWTVSEYNLAAGKWSCRQRNLPLQIGFWQTLCVAFTFQGCVVSVTGPPGPYGHIPKAHVLKQSRLHAASIPLSIPEDCVGRGRGYGFAFSEPFLCLTCFDDQFRAKKVILYDLRLLLPDHEEVSEIPTLPVHQTIDITDDTHAACTQWSHALYFQDEVYLIGGMNCNEVSVFSLSSKAWRRGASAHMSCCNHLTYRFVVDGVLYSVGGNDLHLHGECSKTFEYLDPASAVEGWVKGPGLVKGCDVKSHYVRDGRLFLMGFLNGGTGTSVLQSIAMDDFPAGWRDESALFEGLKLKPEYAFAV